MPCPHCASGGVVRHGQADGLQRYRCRDCGKTFNALSGTPMARLRHKGKWLAQAQVLITVALTPVLSPDVVLCTDGSSAMAAAARLIGVEHHALNMTSGCRVEGPWHIQNVNAYHGRLKAWMHRFHGVATKYLTSYLGWFRALDRFGSKPSPPSSWLALAIRTPGLP